MPFVGNIDEATATFLLLYCLAYIGVNIGPLRKLLPADKRLKTEQPGSVRGNRTQDRSPADSPQVPAGWLVILTQALNRGLLREDAACRDVTRSVSFEVAQFRRYFAGLLGIRCGNWYVSDV